MKNSFQLILILATAVKIVIAGNYNQMPNAPGQYAPKPIGDVPKKYREGYVPKHVKGIFGHAASKLGGAKRALVGGEKWVKDPNHPTIKAQEAAKNASKAPKDNHSGYNNGMKNSRMHNNGMHNNGAYNPNGMGYNNGGPGYGMNGVGGYNSMNMNSGYMPGAGMSSGYGAAQSGYASRPYEPMDGSDSRFPGIGGNGNGISGDSSYRSNSSSSSFSGSISINDIKDGIAAANVIGTYYDTLVERKGSFKGVQPISGILAYPVSNGVYTDYWGKIQFRMGENGGLIDSSGYFIGEPVGSKEDIVKNGSLSDIGFYQKKGISREIMDQNYVFTKMLIEEIGNATQKDVQALHNEKLGLEFLDGIFDYYKRQSKKKKESCLTICVCSNKTCSGPCKSIKCVEPMYLL